MPKQSLSFLRSITIQFCDELELFSLGGLPIPKLIYLEVQNRKKHYGWPSRNEI
ncbi:hypothetical protein MtrunA17_Chr3g0083731 [Medicago truncatula]|uniref:Uncharacterized protein n=1 Tax=Medicago truncatula TaxID=3880 RepID=A0A396IJL7_MEDTR|nr:hypothetical protein MtrunA17_Chr3g0083731 [Medicago truncatula]